MGQFDGLLPSFDYNLTSSPISTLDFVTPPKRQEIFPRSWTLETWAPEADTNSTTEYEANHIYIFDFVEMPCQHILDSDLDDFIAWWNAVRNGAEFTYYPDKDVGGTNYTVVQAMPDGFNPERLNGFWYFNLILRVVS